MLNSIASNTTVNCIRLFFHAHNSHLKEFLIQMFKPITHKADNVLMYIYTLANKQIY